MLVDGKMKQQPATKKLKHLAHTKSLEAQDQIRFTDRGFCWAARRSARLIAPVHHSHDGMHY